jgi:hypothetical protein
VLVLDAELELLDDRSPTPSIGDSFAVGSGVRRGIGDAAEQTIITDALVPPVT